MTAVKKNVVRAMLAWVWWCDCSMKTCPQDKPLPWRQYNPDLRFVKPHHNNLLSQCMQVDSRVDCYSSSSSGGGTVVFCCILSLPTLGDILATPSCQWSGPFLKLTHIFEVLILIVWTQPDGLWILWCYLLSALFSGIQGNTWFCHSSKCKQTAQKLCWSFVRWLL